MCANNTLLRLVSSHATTGTDLRTFTARCVMSARFPIGVATTYSRASRAEGRCRSPRGSRSELEDVGEREGPPGVNVVSLFIPKVPRARCLFTLLAIFAVSGCKSTPPPPEQVSEQPVASPLAAVEASLTRALANDDEALQARHFLEALERLRDLGEAERVEQIVRRMRTPAPGRETALADALSKDLRYRFDAIGLDLALSRGHDREVEHMLARLEPVGSEQERDAMRLRARAQSAVGDYAGAARTLITLVDLVTEPSAINDLSAAIWRHLSHLSVLELGARAESAPTPSARAWWALARDVHGTLTNRDQTRQWQRWRSRHADHPAARHPPQVLGRVSRDPSQLALLLPVTGDFGAAGEAVRDGFLAAYLHAGGESQRVQIYDTNAMSVRAAYDRARQQGAEVIVGPLRREAVATMSALSPTLPVIALNHLDPGVEPAGNMIQFSLAIEDQASAIAEALSEADVQRIVLFDSPARWSVRARARLEDELDDVEAVGFGTFHRVAEVTNIVGDAFLIDESQTRAQEIGSLLGTSFEFTPRRRDDVDAVVALVDAEEFLSLKPALDFHFAGDLPVFAPSTATLDSINLARLEGVRFCAMPWSLDAGAVGRSIFAAFPSSRGAYASLFALGVDGYRLANQHDRLIVRREPIPAGTGVLLLGEDQRIRRTLVWAEVIGDRLVPLFGDAD